MNSTGRSRERGFALLIVLWTLILISLLILQLTEQGGAQARLASNLRRGAIAEQVADGAFQQAAFDLMSTGQSGWSLAGGSHHLVVPGGTADIVVHNEAGKVDLNNASPAVLASLIEAAGASSEDAAAIGQNILAWHTPVSPAQKNQAAAPYLAAGRSYAPPGAAFEDVDELALVLGVTPALFQRLSPHVTVFSGSDPVLSLADPVVRRAAAAAGEVDTGAPTDPGSNNVVDLTVTAHAGGATFVREGVVQLEPNENGDAFRILAWRRPD
jgi:general secretion pathway protein K